MEKIVMWLMMCLFSCILLQKNLAINVAYANGKWFKRIEGNRKLNEGQIDRSKTSVRLICKKSIFDKYKLLWNDLAVNFAYANEKGFGHNEGDRERIDEYKVTKLFNGRISVTDELELFLLILAINEDRANKKWFKHIEYNIDIYNSITNKYVFYKQNLHKRIIDRNIHRNHLLPLAVEGR